MKNLIAICSLLFVLIITVHAQNVGIGTASPSDKLHINAASGTNPLLIQVQSVNKLRVNSNGGTTIGSSVTPPADGLYVAGVMNPFGGIASSTNAINIQSTNDSVEIQAGTNRIVVFANGGIKIVTTGNTGGITIDAGTGNLVLKGNVITMNALTDMNLSSNKNILLSSSVATTIQSSTISVLGTALTKINGGLITLNNGGTPAARAGDFVNVSTGTGVGNIVSGSGSVLIGN
ncbi:hypothetical protein LK994_01160 [Ferruginibacter lapsinanis]|uniref:hypothetical protein n=1 Tax=Ferruginibacter lapsinanis TaxID=563172 RepID=UPI001E380B21|nr:hypothetical protein [Ferruginibacter lapsinanis]UEG50083.1 hypothetical protein LK994_01160 [Ferruginibacter lapsinanis]